jgi:Tfp pilus assembly protein FimT
MSRWDLYTPDSYVRTQRDANHRSSVEDGLRVLLAESSEFCVAARDVHKVERTYARAQYARRILMIMGSITFISLQPALREAQMNAAYDTVLSQIRMARQRAIEERKQYIVCLGAASQPLGAATPLGAPTAQSIQVFRWDVGTAIAAAVQISTINLSQNINFQRMAGFPVAAPDQFGAGGVAIDFDQGVAGGNKQQIMFMPDGAARDTLGNLNNGVVYILRPGTLYSAKAVTVFGSTGRIRGWRLVNAGGTARWIQQ